MSEGIIDVVRSNNGRRMFSRLKKCMNGCEKRSIHPHPHLL